MSIDAQAVTSPQFADIVRLPDLTFASRSRFPGGKLPREPIVPFAPDLAVDIICPGCSPDEINLRVRHYFEGGTRLVWTIWQDERRAKIWFDPESDVAIDAHGMLTAGDILPNLKIPLLRAYEQIDAIATSASPSSSRNRRPRPPR